LVVSKAGLAKGHLVGVAEAVVVAELVVVAVFLAAAWVVARHADVILKVTDLAAWTDVSLVDLPVAVVVDAVAFLISPGIDISVVVIAVGDRVDEGA
jgi:hypothetical protein